MLSQNSKMKKTKLSTQLTSCKYNKNINSNSTRHKPFSLLDVAALTSASGSFSNVANAITRSDLVTSGSTAFCNYACKH